MTDLDPIERPMFPLESALLPDEDLPLRIFEPRYGALVRRCIENDEPFGVVLIAAGRDQVVSTAAIEEIAIRLRAGSHLIVAGAKHELMMEQDNYRAQFWAAFNAFVPGTALY